MKAISFFHNHRTSDVAETFYISGNNHQRIQSIANQYAQIMGYQYVETSFIDKYFHRKFDKLVQLPGNQFKIVRA